MNFFLSFSILHIINPESNQFNMLKRFIKNNIDSSQNGGDDNKENSQSLVIKDLQILNTLIYNKSIKSSDIRYNKNGDIVGIKNISFDSTGNICYKKPKKNRPK